MTCLEWFVYFQQKAEESNASADISLLHDIVSLRLNVQQPDSPFERYLSLTNLSDFQEDKIFRLKELFKTLANDAIELKARIADILQHHLRGKKRLSYAEEAVRYYMLSTKYYTLLTEENTEKIIRASQLAKKYNNKKLINEIKAFFENLTQLQVIENYTTVAELYRTLLWLEVMPSTRLFTRYELQLYANICLKICEQLERIDEGLKAAKEGYEIVLKFPVLKNDVQAKLANVLEKLADSAPVNTIRLLYARAAVEGYRKASSKKYDAEIKRIQPQLPELQKNVFAPTLQQYTISIDGEQLINLVRQKMQKPTVRERIQSLAEIAPFLTVEDAKTFVDPGPIVSTAKHEAYDENWLKTTPNEENESASTLTPKQGSRLKTALSLRGRLIAEAHALVKPGQDVDTRDIEFLIKDSPWVPRDQKNIIMHGLLAGFNKDWMLFAFFIIPNIESMLRYYLKPKGINTTKHNTNGVQENLSLDEILNNEEALKSLDAGLVFELKFLLLGSEGYNLRNRGTHGRLTDKSFDQQEIIILWWIIVKILCETRFPK